MEKVGEILNFKTRINYYIYNYCRLRDLVYQKLVLVSLLGYLDILYYYN